MIIYTRIIPPPVLIWNAEYSARAALHTAHAARLQLDKHQASELVNWENDGGRLQAPGQNELPADSH